MGVRMGGGRILTATCTITLSWHPWACTPLIRPGKVTVLIKINVHSVYSWINNVKVWVTNHEFHSANQVAEQIWKWVGRGHNFIAGRRWKVDGGGGYSDTFFLILKKIPTLSSIRPPTFQLPADKPKKNSFCQKLFSGNALKRWWRGEGEDTITHFWVVQKSQRWAKVQASPPSPSKPVDKQKEIRLFVQRWVGHAPRFQKRGGGWPPGPHPLPVPQPLQQTRTDCNWSWSYHIKFSFVSSNRLTSHKIGRQISAQPNFHTLYKSDQCSSKYELFSDFLVSYESWVHKLSKYIYIYKPFPQNYIYSAAISKVYNFLDTRYKD